MPSLPEQNKIAGFLTSVDDLIESKQKQITQAEAWKRGLMQGLFV
jgi:type I restriction enzyme S subunit